jgi:hypothetical protein
VEFKNLESNNDFGSHIRNTSTILIGASMGLTAKKISDLAQKKSNP